jgi:hypothetical protein
MFPAVVQSIRDGDHAFLPPHLQPEEFDVWSTVSPYNHPYIPPAIGLTVPQQIEALIEGSPLSMLHRHNHPAQIAHSAKQERDAGTMRAKVGRAWADRPSRSERMKGSEMGSTVLIHKVKKDEWWMDTALALLGPQV